MKVCYILLTLSLLLWKAYYAWRRGVNAYDNDHRDHDSLREYLLGNGATEFEALRPFVRHAMVRAFVPLKVQWRLLLILVAVALLAGLVADGLSVWSALAWLFLLMVVVALGTFLSVYIYIQLKK